MPATVSGIHLGPDTHANRPAADAEGLPVGAFYYCSDHDLVYITNGSTWSTWLDNTDTGGDDDQTAAEVPFTPAGTIAATDVQSALQELDGDISDHSARHQSGGDDAIKLDDLAAPDDNTDLDATASAHGLLPKLSGNAAEYLDGTGAFSTPAGGGSASPALKVYLYENYK